MNGSVDETSQIDSEADNILQKQNFGASLKQAREASGISVEDIADRLLISTDIIKAIENSQSESLPAETFTLGYIRSYAKILEIPAEPVIKDYLSAVPDNKKVTTPHSIISENKEAESSFFRSIVILVLVAVFGFGFYWLYNNTASHQAADTAESEQTALAVIDTESTSRYDGAPDQQVLDVEQQFDQPEAESVAPVAAEFSQLVEPVETMQPTQEQQSEPQVAPTSGDNLYLHAGDSSWCEIKDRNDTRLVYRLVKADETLRLSGEAPFQVFLGNAHQITLHINEQEVSFTHLIGSRSKTASLKLHADARVERFRRP